MKLFGKILKIALSLAAILQIVDAGAGADQEYPSCYSVQEALDHVCNDGSLLQLWKQTSAEPFLNILIRNKQVFQAKKALDIKMDSLEKKRLVNLKDERGVAALHLAVTYSTGLAKKLLKRGADIEIEDFNYLTPVFYATFTDNLPALKFLIENRANIYKRDINSATLLHRAAEFGAFKTFKYLVDYLNINSVDNLNNTVMHYAAHSRNLKFLEYLLDLGVTSDTMNLQLKSPIDLAIKFKNYALVKLLKTPKSFNLTADLDLLDFKEKQQLYLESLSIPNGNKTLAALLQLQVPFALPRDDDCPICLQDFDKGESVRILQPCNHLGHTKCIETYFESCMQYKCPLCQQSLSRYTWDIRVPH